ncbi:MAG: sulfurtransferase-like selenium metabolism protein YedF [Turicibacter sp.]|nr:sulfurtransferase-like selenium metabolism protein YedF [Turicibacter sp.]
MFKIDAMGDVCPLPVIKARKALKEHAQIFITVDNEISTQNLSKMATQLGLPVEVGKESATSYRVYIGAGDKAVEVAPSARVATDDYVVVINAQTMGVGDDQLGYALLKGFTYSLAEQDTLPSHVLLYNGGVHLSVEGSEVLDDLNALVTAGVEILSCGACLDFYGLTEKLAVGEVTNMYRIVELMSQHHVVRP